MDHASRALIEEHPPQRMSRWGRIPTALATLVLALGFGVLEAMQGRVRYREVPWSKFWPEAMLRTLPSWVMLAALLPAVLWLSRRVRIGRLSWPVALPLHAAFGVMFVFVHIGLSAVLAAIVRQSSEHTVEIAFRSMFSGYAVMGFFTYACIVAAHHAFRAQAESYAREAASRELQSSLTRAQLQALRSQLDPHFLFNALNSISVIALTGERETVVRLIAGLGDVLRMSLDGGGAQEVPLGAELELLGRYLELEHVRFGDRLTVERDIEPGLHGALVPSLLLQPIVENAIKYGVAASREKVILRIAAAPDGAGRLALTVTNRSDGKRASSALATPAHGTGVGLANVCGRLTARFGDAATCTYGPLGDAAYEVRLSMPFEPAPDPESRANG